MPLLMLTAAIAVLVWTALLLNWLRDKSIDNRSQRGHTVATLLLVVLVAGAIVAQCLTPRAATFTGLGTSADQVNSSRGADLVGQVSISIALVLAVCLLICGRVRSRSLFLAGLSLATASAFSSAFSTHPGFLHQMFYLPLFVVVLSTVALIHIQALHLVRFITRAYVYCSLLAAVVAPGWAFNPAPGGVPLGFVSGRLYGVGLHPNYLGFVAVLAILAETASPRARLWYVHVGFALLVLVLAASRGAYLALVASALVYALWSARRRDTGVVTLIAVFGLALVGGYLIANTRGANTLNGRTSIWHETMSLWRQSPVLGVGPIPHAHNQVLESLAEGGIVGAIFLLLVIWILFFAALREWHNGFPTCMAAFAAFTCFMGAESALRVGGISTALCVALASLLLIAAPAAHASAPVEAKVGRRWQAHVASI
jgi:O-antigen ligase